MLLPSTRALVLGQLKILLDRWPIVLLTVVCGYIPHDRLILLQDEPDNKTGIWSVDVSMKKQPLSEHDSVVERLIGSPYALISSVNGVASRLVSFGSDTKPSLRHRFKGTSSAVVYCVCWCVK